MQTYFLVFMDYLFNDIQTAEGSSLQKGLCIDVFRGILREAGPCQKHFPAKIEGQGQKHMQIRTFNHHCFFGVTSEPSFTIVFSFGLVVNNDPQPGNVVDK